MSMFAPISKFARWFLTLPIVARLGISILVSIIGGLGVGIIGEYAAYSYALNLGFRPPFEGVPYLRATVGAFTVMLLLGLFATFTLIYYTTELPLASLRRTAAQLADTLETQLAGSEVVIGQIGPEVIKHLDSRLWKVAARIYGMDFDPVRESLAQGNPKAAITSMGKAIREARVFSPAIPVWLASFSGIVVVAGLCLALFDTGNYKQLLCTINYGGHIPVTLQIRNDGASKPDPDHGELVLRSTSSITIRNGSAYREYPLESVRAIDYPASLSCTE